MMVKLILLSLILGVFVVLGLSMAPPAGAAANGARVPILVELFTSEGCSSCPPADALLQKFDQQPVPGAQLIVLSEHVDYWNHIGWKDPYSSRFYSDRQNAYGTRFGLESVYTPQMVIDGTTEFVGSNATLATKAITQALQTPKTGVRLLSTSIEPGQFVRFTLEVDAPPPALSSREAQVFALVAFNHAQSEISAGENSGRTLSHVAVARNLVQVGRLKAGENFVHDLQLKLEPGWDVHNLRLIAFVQDSGNGKVLGAAEQVLH
jgi:hypothetical protein